MSDATLQQLLDRRAAFLGFVERRVGDPTLAEDILQAAFVRAIEHEPAPRAEQSVVAWFYTVLRNAVIDFYRRRATEAKVLDPTAFDDAAHTATTPDADTRTFLCGCIAFVLPTLKPAYAEILREVDLEERSLADFAARHHVTTGNAAVRAHRARAALKRELVRVCGACSIHACLDCRCKKQATVAGGDATGMERL